MIDSKKLKLFEKKINYKFKNNKLLIQSLTHPSFYLENEKKIKINEFERFEFLGDRVLGLIIANLLNFYLWYLVYINFGSGSNYFDKSSKSVKIKRKGLFNDIEVKLNFDEIKSVKLDISEGFNPRRRIALVLKGRKKPLPLSGAGELKPLLQVEEEGARLAKFLNVKLEGLK